MEGEGGGGTGTGTGTVYGQKLTDVTAPRGGSGKARTKA